MVRAKLNSRWQVPFVATEHIFGWIVYFLGNWAFLEMLFYLHSLSVLIAVIVYFSGAEHRVMQRHYQAWQVINTAQGKGGNGGRIDALQELVNDKVPLIGVDVGGAFLQGVRLDGAQLVRANFHNSDARHSSLTRADLSNADLTGANLRGSNLRESVLRGADLTEADLGEADLSGADLSGSVLDNADLQGADLSNVRWQKIKSIKSANLHGTKNASPEFVQWALQHGALRVRSEQDLANPAGQ
jgi:uncharacterized protein YjbI with pentapeptide repeats